MLVPEEVGFRPGVCLVHEKCRLDPSLGVLADVFDGCGGHFQVGVKRLD